MKFFKKAVCMMMCMSMTACTNTNTSQYQLQDGTYTATKQGFNGDITLELIVKDGNLNQIEVIDENETSVLSTYALTKIPEIVVDKQTINVDVSTGATITSNAVLEAIEDCLQQAEANIDEWQSETAVSLKEQEKVDTTQVVIIGGGPSGISSALRLNQLGISTTLIEKSKQLGGGLLYNFEQSQIYDDVLDDGQTFDFLSYGEDVQWQILQNEFEDTIAWQENDLGLEFQISEEDTSSYTATYMDQAGMMLELLQKEVNASNVECYTSTYAYQIKEDDTDNQGYIVQAKSSNGTYYEIYCDYVILACGSLQENNQIESIDHVEIQNGEKEIRTAFGLQIDEDTTIDIFDAYQQAVSQGAILVNEEGKRIVDETQLRITQDQVLLSDLQNYIVMNERAYQKFKNTILDHTILDKDIQKIIKNDALENVITEDTVTKTIRETSIHESTLLETMVSCYGYYEESAQDELGRETFTRIIEMDETCYIIPLTPISLPNANSYIVDENLIVQSELLTNIYAIGNASGSFMEDVQLEGIHTTYAFTSGKYVADQIATSYQEIQ